MAATAVHAYVNDMGTSADGGKERDFSRRRLLQSGTAAVAGALGTLGAASSARAAAPEASPINLPNLLSPAEREQQKPPAPLPPDKRVGFAIVGLGRLALHQILPAFAESERCRPVALVSGDRAKATAVAAKYGIATDAIYDYQSYDRLRDNSKVDVVYIVLPNGMHAEYSVRAARAGKHVLCEKPMANTVAECQQMIDAARKADKKLMIAYRLQYEPYNREAIRMARAGELGVLKALSATNGQTQGDPKQWRLKKALAGGGALPDVGIYCLNAARYLTGEEPSEAMGFVHSTPNDPRFREVEEQVDFVLRFPSGFQAACTTSYGFHSSKRFRLMGDTAWVELDPAFTYEGLQMRVGRKLGGEVEELQQRSLPAKNHFALEMDHMASCVRSGAKPHTPGEEGLQDARVIAAIYESARRGRAIKLDMSAARGRDAFRGPEPV